MLILKNQDGAVLRFSDFEFVGSSFLALYGSEASYSIEQDDLAGKLQSGNCFEEKLPILYDTAHGLPTDSSIQQFGVPVSVVSFHKDRTKADLRSFVKILRSVHNK